MQQVVLVWLLWILANLLPFWPHEWTRPSPPTVSYGIAWLPIILAAIGAGSSLLGGRNKATPAPPGNKYQSPDDMGIPKTLPDGRPNPIYEWMTTGIIPGSDQPTVTEMRGGSSTTTDSTTTSKGTSKTFPTFAPSAQGVVDLIPNLLKHRVLEGGKIGHAERMGVLEGIAGDASMAEKGLINQLSDRGLLGSPIEAGGREGIARAALGARAGYLTGIPQMERSRANEDLGVVNAVLANLFKGSQTDMNNTSRTQGVSDTMSNSLTTTTGPPQFDPRILGALLQPGQAQAPGTNPWDSVGGIGEMLMLLFGMGAFDKGGKSGSKMGTAKNPRVITGY